MPPNREPMWYCHECRSEMRPLMVPDPHCASCNGAFVEMLESQQDDPRTWRNMETGDDGGYDAFAAHLRETLPGLMPGGRGGFALSINRSSYPGGNTRTGFFNEPGRTDVGPGRVMPLREYLAENARNRGGGITGEGLTEALANFISLNQHTGRRGPGAPNPFASISGIPLEATQRGRSGDYRLNEQYIDLIAAVLLENSNPHRPVAVTEEAIDKLDHQVLEEGSPLLEKDCAVCKDQFSLQTDDPDEQLVVTLPCKHPFHSPCITPWLKQNGTCPTCRYQLVPQPGSTQNPNNHSGTVPGPSTSTTNPPRPTSSAIPEPTGRNDGAEGGFLSSLGNMLHSWAGGHPTTGPVPSSSDSGPDFLPGRWETHPSSGLEPRHPPATSYEDQRGSPNSPSYTNPDRRDRRGGSIGERIPHHSGSHRRDSNGERGRRDRAGQRGYPWDRQTPG